MSKVAIRVGEGVDIHKFVSSRPLILGGVHVPHEFGLEGHSDADVLTHAIADALLGAACLGDIGQLFPNTDEKWKNANSLELLKIVNEKLKQNFWRVINIDATVLCEQPKLLPYTYKMRQNLAEILKIEVSACSIKATTAETLGFVGRKEGILAKAIALITNEH